MARDELGGKFWLWVIGVAIAIGIGGMLFFLLLGSVWYSWGGFGALIFFGAILLGWGWWYDRKQAKRYDELS